MGAHLPVLFDVGLGVDEREDGDHLVRLRLSLRVKVRLRVGVRFRVRVRVK